MQSWSRALALTLLACAAATAAHAGISSSGSGIEIRAPVLTVDTGWNNELDENEYESDTTLRVWFEKFVTIDQSMDLDHVTAGTGGTGTFTSNSSLNGGTLANGTAIDSYYLHFDPVTSTGTRLTNSSGSLSITFDTDILGLALDDNGFDGGNVGLNESDNGTGDADGNQSFQGPGSLTYRNHGSRGFELGTTLNRDRFSISADRRTLTILNVYEGNHEADMRIFVAHAAVVPEPGTVVLFGAGTTGLAGLIVLRGRRRRRMSRTEA